jgi:hypothetical protein
MLKKLVIVSVSSIFLLSVVVSADSYAQEKEFSFWNPLKNIWIMLHDLADRVSDLEELVPKVINQFKLMWRSFNRHEERITDLEEIPRVAGLKVYDADGQFLGFATDLDYIYNPSLQRFLRIDLSDGDFRGATLFFESSDCSGKGYSFPETSYSYFENTYKYYAGKKIEPVSIHVKSQRAYPENHQHCVEVTWGEVYYYLVPVREVNPPISLPVALPLNYEIK